MYPLLIFDIICSWCLPYIVRLCDYNHTVYWIELLVVNCDICYVMLRKVCRPIIIRNECLQVYKSPRASLELASIICEYKSAICDVILPIRMIKWSQSQEFVDWVHSNQIMDDQNLVFSSMTTSVWCYLCSRLGGLKYTWYRTKCFIFQLLEKHLNGTIVFDNDHSHYLRSSE